MNEEIWVPCCYSSDYEVSSLGRFRNAKTKREYCGSLNKSKGYIEISIHHNVKKYLHRVVFFSFNPGLDENNLTIDHINGIRTDNRLENLRCMSNLENINLMKQHQFEYIKEFTRLVNKYGYEDALNKIKKIE